MKLAQVWSGTFTSPDVYILVQVWPLQPMPEGNTPIVLDRIRGVLEDVEAPILEGQGIPAPVATMQGGWLGYGWGMPDEPVKPPEPPPVPPQPQPLYRAKAKSGLNVRDGKGNPVMVGGRAKIIATGTVVDVWAENVTAGTLTNRSVIVPPDAPVQENVWGTYLERVP